MVSQELWSADLRERYRAGERGALNVVYRAYSAEVASMVLALARGNSAGGASRRSLVADVVQDTFLHAFEPKSRARIDSTLNYVAYLRAIARNAFIDHWRRSKRTTAYRDDELGRALDIATLGSSNAAGHDDLLDFLDCYVAHLTEPLRAVFVALYVDGLSQRGVAAKLGMGRQQVRTLAAKLLTLSRRHLAKHGDAQRRPSGREDRMTALSRTVVFRTY